jgi:hypothetical protein
MRLKSLLILNIFLVGFSCSNEIKNTQSTSESDSIYFEQFAIKYDPKNIDMSKDLNDTLLDYDLKKLFDNVSEFRKEKWVDILLLKQYYFHLKSANQGFDLYSMRKGQSAIIINQFLLQNKLKLEGEFLNSGCVYEAVIKRDSLLNDSTISNLLHEIDIESRRINKE